MVSSLDHLNPQQRAAVTAPDGPTLVIAAAGTGKTLTLTHRLAWLVQERGIKPWSILLLTFTNRAAREMLDRAEQLIGATGDRPWGGTFHHVANRMLRRHADLIGYDRSFAILDEDDSTRLLKGCIADLGLKDKKFPKPEVLSSLFGLAISRKVPLEDLLAAHFDSHEKDVDGMMRVHEMYQQRKREVQGMDFDDLLVQALTLLQEHPGVAERYRDQFQHVLVDEYQDTSRIQSDFVDLLAAGHGNLMAVGDDFQSIYSWRGAEVSNILAFGERHPGARVFKLEENYRSVPGVLAVANDVIAANPEQYQKTLVATRESDVKPALIHLSDGRHQARYVIEHIMRLIESGTVRPGEIAVLYRSHFHAMELQMELARAQLQYTIVSGVRFFEQAHIKDVCAPLRLAANPVDKLAFARWMEMLPKVGPKRVQSLWDKLGSHFNLRDAAKRTILHQALPAEAQPIWKTTEDALFPTGASDSGALLDRPDELIHRFVSAFYEEFAEDTFDNVRIRMDDIDELENYSSKYSTTADFLSELALQTNLDSAPQTKSSVATADAIRLTTVHQAKGLEWRAVFVLWMVEGMFPSMRSTEEAGSDAEERRLFYVAVTRAKDYLWMCVPKMRKVGRDGGIQICMPSRFIDEIGEDKLQIGHPAPPLPPAWHGTHWRN